MNNQMRPISPVGYVDGVQFALALSMLRKYYYYLVCVCLGLHQSSQLHCITSELHK